MPSASTDATDQVVRRQVGPAAPPEVPSLRKLGLQVAMTSGDRRTAAAITGRMVVDSVLAEDLRRNEPDGAPDPRADRAPSDDGSAEESPASEWACW